MLVIVGSALLVATSLLFIAQAEVAGASNTARTAQSRAMIESGLEVVIGRLQSQREAILDGDVPELDQQYELYEHGSAIGVVRLLAVTPDDQRLDPQAGKIDLNAEELTADMLSETGMVEHAIAEAIIEHRSQRGLFQSVPELLNVPGVTVEMLYGPLDDLLDDDTDFAEGDVAERVAARFVNEEPRGLADIFTVFAVEPELQRDGVRRINLNVPWSDELGHRLDDRFGEGAGEIVKQILDDGAAFDEIAALFRVFAAYDVEPDEWPEFVDALTTTDETYTFGRIDINTAGEAVLRALPGISPEQATEIVRVRDTLSTEERSTIAWPAQLGIIEPEAYQQLGSWLTVRSWTYRVRLAAGEVNADAVEAELRNPMIFEAVIDLAAPQPRVAYLRDITMFRTTAMLASAQVPGNRFDGDWYDEDEEPWEDPAAEEDAMSLDWPDEEESWPSDHLADETEGANATEATDPRRRLGRWRSPNG